MRVGWMLCGYARNFRESVSYICIGTDRLRLMFLVLHGRHQKKSVVLCCSCCWILLYCCEKNILIYHDELMAVLTSNQETRRI